MSDLLTILQQTCHNDAIDNKYAGETLISLWQRARFS